MQKEEQLYILQLQWLEALYYDQYLQSLAQYKKHPTLDHKQQWEQSATQYIRVLSKLDNYQQ